MTAEAAIALLCVAAVLAALAGALWQVVCRRGVVRVWWALCALLVLIGLVGLAVTLLCPWLVVEAAADGTVSGEMPPAFAVSLTVLAFGTAVTLAGFARAGLAALLRQRPLR